MTDQEKKIIGNFFRNQSIMCWSHYDFCRHHTEKDSEKERIVK